MWSTINGVAEKGEKRSEMLKPTTISSECCTDI